MAVICKTCEAKDQMIEYLKSANDRLMAQVWELTKPYAVTNQTFHPSYVNDMGEVVKIMDEPKETTVIETVVRNDLGEDEIVTQEVEVANEILGH